MKSHHNFAQTSGKPMKKAARTPYASRASKPKGIASLLIFRIVLLTVLTLSAFLLTGCNGSMTPSGDFELERPTPEAEGPCLQPNTPVGNRAGDLQIALVGYASALVDCAERKQQVQDHYERQRVILQGAF